MPDTVAAGENEPFVRRSVREATDRTLAERSIVAVLAHMVLLTIILAVTDAVHLHPIAGSLVFGWKACVGVVRLTIGRSFARVYPENPTRWRLAFRVMTIVAGLSWGTPCALWMRSTAWGTQSMLVLVITAGITAGALTSLSPSLALVRTYVACMLLPTVMATLVFGDHSKIELGFVLVLVLHFAFLFIEARHQHDGFVGAIEQNVLLGEKADALAERSESMRLVLDNVGQGFLTVDRDGAIGDDRSAILEKWLGRARDRELIWDYAGRTAPTFGTWLQLGWRQLAASTLPVDVALAQLPRRFAVGSRSYAADYRPIAGAESAAGFLVIVSDITSEVERAHSDEERGEALAVLDHLQHDRTGFLAFMGEGEALIAALVDPMGASADEQRRWLHTLKGNASTFDLVRMARRCHELETALDEREETLSDAERASLASVWALTLGPLRAAIGKERDVLNVPLTDYIDLVSALRNGAPPAEVLTLVQPWPLDRMESRLYGLGQQAGAIARRLGKELEVVIEDNGLRFSGEALAPMWCGMTHVLRNALDHGIETPAEREESGKKRTGTLTLRTEIVDEVVTITVGDDGRGIDWEALRDRAAAAGRPAATQTDLVAALFVDGMTTRTSITELSGRGVGLGAFRESVLELGGSVEVRSKAGAGTAIVARIPLEAASYSAASARSLGGIDRPSDAASLPATAHLHSERDRAVLEKRLAP